MRSAVFRAGHTGRVLPPLQPCQNLASHRRPSCPSGAAPRIPDPNQIGCSDGCTVRAFQLWRPFRTGGTFALAL